MTTNDIKYVSTVNDGLEIYAFLKQATKGDITKSKL